MMGRTPTDYIEDARALDRVIQCDHGGTYSAEFVAIDDVLAGRFVGMYLHRAVDPDGHVVEEATVQDYIRLCVPEVELVSRDESVFPTASGVGDEA